MAEEEYNKSLEIHYKLVEIYPDAYLQNLAVNLDNLARLHIQLNKYKLAEDENNKALNIFCRLTEIYPDLFLPKVVDKLKDLSDLHWILGKYDVAEQEYTEVISIYGKLEEESPTIYNSKIASAMNMLAYCQYKLGKNGLVLPTIEKAISLDPIAEYYDSKGELLMLLGKKEEAKTVYEKILEIEPTYFDDKRSEFYKLLFGEQQQQ